MTGLAETGRRVLIVDDDEGARLITGISLENAGFSTVQACSGEEALEVFAEISPDIMLLDLNMPGIDGYEVCRRLRKLSTGATIPVLVLTGSEDIDSIELAYEAGATDFLTKTTNYAIIVHRVRYMLRASFAFRELERNQRSLASAQRIARMGSWEWHASNDRFFLSDEILSMFDIRPENFPKSYPDLMRYVHHEDQEQVGATFKASIHDRKPFSLNHRVMMSGGKERNVFSQVDVKLDADGRVAMIYGTMQDITERLLTEEKIRLLAYYDPLTELPNRRLLRDRMQQAIDYADRNKTKVALLFLDLDNFKTINDSLGHSVGDALLEEIAARLRECVRDTDTVSRQGGDEFLILLPDLPDADATAPVLVKIKERLQELFHADCHELSTSVSIGVAIYPDDGGDFDTLLRKADTAMYSAKDAGRNTYRFFDEKMNVEAVENHFMRTGLRRALECNEFVLHYQPQIDLASNAVVGAEALIRWNHPELGMIPPLRFIPVAEESGLIVPIGEWVIREACRQATAWRKAALPELIVAVNLSSVQFKHGNLEQTVISALEDSGLDPSFLELELTESILIRNTDSVLATVQRRKSVV